ncbi:MAG: class I SAM-dependent methyltransferase [Candidatus Dormibacteria bacterium]
MAAEDRHFWFRARNDIIRSALRRLVPALPRGPRALEIGCGTGNVLRVLKDELGGGTVIGMELFEDGARRARSRVGCEVISGTLEESDLAGRFDLVGMFDVLEHLDDDVATLQQVAALLDGAGYFMATVPAHPWLWSRFDEASMHRRRYTAASLTRALEAGGFEVRYLTYFMSALLPPFWLRRRLTRDGPLRGHPNAHADLRDELRVVPGFNALAYHVLRQEARLTGRHRKLPFGTSLLAIARRR